MRKIYIDRVILSSNPLVLIDDIHLIEIVGNGCATISSKNLDEREENEECFALFLSVCLSSESFSVAISQLNCFSVKKTDRKTGQLNEHK